VKKIHKYSDEATLVVALKARQEDAIAYLYDNYSNALFGVIDRIIQSEDVSNDVLQDAFVKIWKNIDGYTREKGSLFTWMLNICRNTAIDETRSKQYKNQLQNQNIEDSVNSIDKVENVQLKVDHIGLKEVVATLKPEQKLLVDKIYFEGYTQEEVSKEFNIPLGTVKTRIRAAIGQLRGALVTSNG
jgi:RNA polymerase sigma-70 factor, ECF subfamily